MDSRKYFNKVDLKAKRKEEKLQKEKKEKVVSESDEESGEDE